MIPPPLRRRLHFTNGVRFAIGTLDKSLLPHSKWKAMNSSKLGNTFNRGSFSLVSNLLILFMLSLLLPERGEARPEYAVRIGNNRCTNCHYSPAGGGPRNMNGKYYGAYGFKLSPFSAQPYAGADIKWLYYSPEKHSRAKGGLATMSGSPWVAVPIHETEARDAHVVAEQNIGGFALSGPRNLYLRYQVRDPAATGLWPQSVVVGRFIPAYGLMTDEHDTYVRMQTLSMWSLGIRMGAMFSGNPIEAIHYDISLVNGLENLGTTLERSKSSQFGAILNLRWLPASAMGFLIGGSAAHYDAPADDPTAVPPVHLKSSSSQSVYSVVSLHNLSNGYMPVSVLAEYARASNMNLASWTGKFISFPAAYDPAGATSEGWLAQINYDVSAHWVLTYKYDRLMLDRDYPGDVYQRHGLGAKHFFGPNMWFLLRYDRSTSSRPNEEMGTGIGANDAYWALLSVSI